MKGSSRKTARVIPIERNCYFATMQTLAREDGWPKEQYRRDAQKRRKLTLRFFNFVAGAPSRELGALESTMARCEDQRRGCQRLLS